jgi:hypothetical protein
MMRALSPFLALCGLGIFIAACQPLNFGPGTAGELGNGVFTYHCVSDGDAFCDDLGDFGAAMPTSIAVGSRFRVTYTPSGNEGNTGSATVKPVSQELLLRTSDIESALKAVKPGVAGMLAVRGLTVVDIIHVRLANVVAVRVEASFDSGSANGITKVAIPPGGDVLLRAVGVDEADERLAGAMSATWSSDDKSIAEIVTLPTDNQVRVQGGAPGETKLRVTLGEKSAEVVVIVSSAGAGGEGGGGGMGGAGGMGGSGGAGGSP